MKRLPFLAFAMFLLHKALTGIWKTALIICSIVGGSIIYFSIFPDSFIIQQMGVKMRVEGDPRNASTGDFVRLKAIFHKENYLEAVRFYAEKGRRLKIFISIFC